MLHTKITDILRYVSVTVIFSLLIIAYYKDVSEKPEVYTVSVAKDICDSSLPDTSAVSCILCDAGSGEVLYSKNSDEKLPMASTTKIMTALTVLEKADLSENVTVKKESVGIEGSSIYLTEGEMLTVEELLYGLLLESGNDAAHALSLHVGKTEKGFCDMMNEKAASLGLSSTHFDNPHGLFSESHYTTARELAVIASEAMKNDVFRRIVATKKYHIEERENCRERYFSNHNRLLNTLENCVGVKTGYTLKAGRCLVSATCDGESTFIAVTLNDRRDFSDHTALHTYAAENYKSILVAKRGELKYSFGDRIVQNTEDIYITVKKDFSEPIALDVIIGTPDENGACGVVRVMYGDNFKEFLVY